MVIPTGSYKASDVNIELGRTSTIKYSASDSAVRNLAGDTSGPYSASQLQGKSAVFSTVASNPNTDNSTRSNWYEFNPTHFNGYSISQLGITDYFTSYTKFVLSGILASNFFSYIEYEGTILYTSNASSFTTYSNNNTSEWVWDNQILVPVTNNGPITLKLGE